MRAIALSYLDGFALAGTRPPTNLITDLSALPADPRGVYYEGAAAAKTLSALTSQGDLLETAQLLEESPRYSFLIYMGIGETMAQLRISPTACSSAPGSGWPAQVWEGYGFFDGYFRWFDTLIHQKYPVGLPTELEAAYDQGLGRAIYFLTNGKPYEIRDYISTFSPVRQKEMWAGLGHPASYAGGCEEGVLRKLLELSRDNRIELMQGVLLGVATRMQQNHVPDFTNALHNIVCSNTTGSATINQDIDQLIIEWRNYQMLDWQEKIRSSLKMELT